MTATKTGEASATAYETVIGLECHAQLLTKTKLFCGCQTSFGDPPNTHVCPTCVGLPGALPVLNEAAVALAARMALAVGCEVHQTSIFARKNYFYPDLPKGYQISQYDRPLATNGSVTIHLEGAAPKRIAIERIHMEEDAGKLLHEGFSDAARKSGVDFNRSGVPLIEIVSEPVMSSPEEAVAYAEALKEILQYAAVSDADMEKGNFRFDANISLRPVGATELGTKVELKNLNSFRFLTRALTYEVARQAKLLEASERVVQETRLYDADADRTVSMRSKEEAHDYRYFPDPDLPPLTLEEALLEKVRASVPELPAAKRERLVKEYALPEYDAGVLAASRELADFFEVAARTSRNPKAASNWVMTEVLRKLKESEGNLTSLSLTGEALGKLILLVDGGSISGKIAKDVFEKMLATGDEADAIIEREGLSQISDPEALGAMIREVLAKHPDQVEEYRGGKDKVLGFFVGQIMKASKGKANPALTREILLRLIAEP